MKSFSNRAIDFCSFLSWPSCSVERNGFSNLGKGASMEDLREIYFEIRPMAWRCRLKIFLYLDLAAILFSGTGPFEHFWYSGIRGKCL